eukprot:scaffold4049_cov204-Alexandrium_tamarense.AAC.28
MEGDDEQPFLINAYTSSVAGGYQKGLPRRDRNNNEEAKLADVEAPPNNATTPKYGNNLRRRFRRKDATEENEDNSKNSAVMDETTPPKQQKPLSSSSQPSNHHRSSLPLMQNLNYIRKLPDAKLKEKFKHRLRSVADSIPEVHFIGEICEGIGFNDSFVSCKWYLEWGKSWSFLAGDDSSQTQYACSDDGVQVWSHPIDVHFASASMQGWPRIIVQVWELDEFGRSSLSGYGFVHLPTNAGE